MITTKERAPDDLDPMKKLIEALSTKLRVAAPGIIQSFDAAAQTVEVKIAIKERVNNQGVLEEVEIPILVDVPVQVPQGGGYALTLPIVQGDECLVVFADNCIDSWWQNGGVQGQFERRRHNLSDGFAIIGVKSQPNVLAAYSTDSAQLRNDTGDTLVEVKNGEVNVTAAAVNLSDGTLRQLIDERLLTAFNNHTHPTAGTGAPSTPTVPLVLNNIATTKTKAG